MKVTHADTAAKGGSSDHRPGGVSFTYLLEGEEFAPDNFSLMLVHVAEHYHAPRHRHNFEQIRVMLDGHFGFGPGQEQGPGSVGYFCEGTYYTQDGRDPSITLLLQVAGASGTGYMSNRQLRDGVEALKSRGSFADGVYTWLDEQGKKHNQDGYEAVWEQTFGRKLTYPKPRYQAPVLLNPDHFAWIADPSNPGLSIKHLGTFNERCLSLQMLRVAKGARVTLGPQAERRLGYLWAGAGQTDSGQALKKGSAFDWPAGESLTLQSHPTGLEIMLFHLPQFGR